MCRALDEAASETDKKAAKKKELIAKQDEGNAERQAEENNAKIQSSTELTAKAAAKVHEEQEAMYEKQFKVKWLLC